VRGVEVREEEAGEGKQGRGEEETIRGGEREVEGVFC
jgi:hypothetical protein